MTDTAKNTEHEAFSLASYRTEEIYAYYVDATGTCVTADSSVSLIHRYCEKLPGDKYEQLNLVNDIRCVTFNVQCFLILVTYVIWMH